MYTPAKERAKVIRHALTTKIKADKISVIKGTGTASSWVKAYITIPAVKDCTCEQYRAEHTYGYCERCRLAMNTTSKAVEEIADKALAAMGMEHSTFTSDDGYNSECSEFAVQVSIANNY